MQTFAHRVYSIELNQAVRFDVQQTPHFYTTENAHVILLGLLYMLPRLRFDQWLKWFCEAGGSPDEARLEKTPYPFQPH